MSLLVRLYEKIAGLAHQHRESHQVSEKMRELSHSMRELHDSLEPYVEAEDPLVALMTDVFNQRRMQGDPPEPEVSSNDDDKHTGQ
jgi:cell fate (sporulation/competence/biofilm development) regulator YlbF (YheA/YmcA/DUF963 family)